MTARPTPPVYGVDFGMTTSSLAVVAGDDRPVLVEDPAVPAGGVRLIPSAVLLQEDTGAFLVGTAAVNAAKGAPRLFRDRFKRSVGRHPDVFVGERSIPLERLVAEVLGLLRARAEQIVETPPSTVVLTVPASWRSAQREFMKQAADLAGFSRRALRIVDEPAAAFTYARGIAAVDDSQPVLVYDLGGSTFDCALLVPDDGSGEPRLFRDGLPGLGGTDFDQFILDDLADRYPPVRDFRADAPNQSPSMDELRRTCERIKHRLSDVDTVEERLVEVPGQPVVTLTRERFESLIDGEIRRTVELCRGLLDKANIRADQLRTVVPVGGGARIPLVRGRLREFAPGTVVEVPEPELAVALGAAAMAQDLRADAPPGPAVPAVFAEPASTADAELTGLPLRKIRPDLAASWMFTLVWAIALIILAVNHWQSPGVREATIAATAACGAGLVALGFRRSLARVVIAGTVLVGVAVPVVAGAYYVYRTFAEEGDRWPMVGWAAGIAVLATIAAFNIDEAVSTWRRREKETGEAHAIAERLREQRWFGAAEQPPELFASLLTIPSVRVFDIGAGDTDGVQYAISSGRIVFLVHLAATPDARPTLAAAAQRWTRDLTGEVYDAQVTTLLVYPGHRVPPMPDRVRVRLGVQVTTRRSFVDVVGDWLAEADTVDVRIATPLLQAADRRKQAGSDGGVLTTP